MLRTLLFDYVQHLDPGDRVRRARARPTGSRVRRIAGGARG